MTSQCEEICRIFVEVSIDCLRNREPFLQISQDHIGAGVGGTVFDAVDTAPSGVDGVHEVKPSNHVLLDESPEQCAQKREA